MADVKWTKEQKQAILEKDTNILVAAAAGSGKTAVLVERIIHKIVEEKVDIDSLLVVTFTNAAASEMRERVLDAIYQKLEEIPGDENLRRQMNLLNKASICTIHSFCLEVIRNHFYEIEVSPNFRIGDTPEIELLKQETIEELFEEKYEKEEKEFLNLLHIYTGYRGDEPLKDLILTIYRSIQSNPFPEKWLEEKIEEYHIKDIDKDFSSTKWGQILLHSYQEQIEETILGIQSVKRKLDSNPELEKFSKAMEKDLIALSELEANTDSWDKSYQLASNFSFAKWPVDRKITSSIKEEAKHIRDKIKKRFDSKIEKIFIYSSKQANEDIFSLYEIVKQLKNLIIEFSKKFSAKKREKNVIDFNDIEHFALQILLKQEKDKIIPTKVAKEYQEKFTEIAIDEYQDSNLVQEYILNAIAKGNNLFMVGDVKQSIYRFRQARPELFIEKYETYLSKEVKTENSNLKIQLFKNFRSRQNVLEITNLVFQDIMSKSLGDISYTKEEYLNLGANFEQIEDSSCLGKAELHILEMTENDEEENESIYLTEQEDTEQRIEDSVLEARFVASQIRQLIKQKKQVYDRKQGYRDVSYRDIVILLRATSVLAPVYEQELTNLGIPVFSDTSSEYLESIEIETIMALLKIIDNPYQDIPFVTVLRSMIGSFTDNELIEIRLADPYTYFYEAMIKAKIQVSDELRQKIEDFLKRLETWRQVQEYLPLDELIWQIYLDTGYYYYIGLMPNGNLRQANLKMLFERAKEYESASFKGLFNFIRFIDKLKVSSGDLGAAKVIGENENVVRIMSIHKSKGLEFPVVFLSSMGKHFNLQDLNKNILLHQDLGLGHNYINYEKRIEYPTMPKEAIKIQMKQETLSEEMRILYVALTRAKEKLILTGITKELEKAFQEKEEQLAIFREKQGKLNPYLVGKYTSYLDWMELVYLHQKQKVQEEQSEELFSIYIHKKEELLEKNQKEELEEILDMGKIVKEKAERKKEYQEEIQSQLDWQYEFKQDISLPGKVSVTKLKQLEMEKQEQRGIINDFVEKDKDIENVDILTTKPNFLRETDKLSNAEKGTLLHLCMQRLDPKIDYTIEVIQEMIQKMLYHQIITQAEADEISPNQVLQFTKSKIWKEMQSAKQVEKEKPFYITIPAKEIYEYESDNEILVQGIIDLYYITKENQLVLVDYKTDYVPNKEESYLIHKYEIQLKLYQRALEEAMNRKVEEVYIYSTYLGKEIRLK